MTGFECIRSGGLLQKQAGGLSSAEALRLEEHLAACTACRGEAAVLQGLRGLYKEGSATLGSVARERAIRNAFQEAQTMPTVERGPRAMPLFAGAAAGVVAVAAVLFLVARPNLVPRLADHTQVRVTAKPLAVTERVDRVLAGALEVDGHASVAGASLARRVTLHASQTATVALAHAQVELAPGTLVRWEADAHAVHLQSGSLVADVDPAAHAPFTVVTPRFHVLVLGTRFTVTLDAVQVARGRVRVTANDGRVLAEAVSAGERFDYEQPQLANASTGHAEPQPAIASVPSPQPVRRGDALPLAHVELGALLHEIREQLAAKQLPRAHELLEHAATLPGEPAQRADAMSLRAEWALLGGHQGEAIEVYLQVSQRFAKLPAGENALFAAARLEAERGRDAAAAQLLKRYLQSYPHGHFVKEAQSRLHSLTIVLDRAP